MFGNPLSHPEWALRGHRPWNSTDRTRSLSPRPSVEEAAPAPSSLRTRNRRRTTSGGHLSHARAVDIDQDFVYGYFRTLKLHAKKITAIDEEMNKLKNLEELSLTGNEIERVENLPHTLQILHLNANRLTQCPDVSRLPHLIHLGLGYNSIQSLTDVCGSAELLSTKGGEGRKGKSLRQAISRRTDLNIRRQTASVISSATAWLPSTLVSLDMSWNSLGNPITLLNAYRGFVVSRLRRLISLDDVTVTTLERNSISAADRGGEREPSTGLRSYDFRLSDVAMIFKVQQMTGVEQPVVNPSEDPDQPPEEYAFFVEIKIDGYDEIRVCSQPVPWAEGLLTFDFSKDLLIPISVKFRDALKGDPHESDIRGETPNSSASPSPHLTKIVYVVKVQEEVPLEGDKIVAASERVGSGKRPPSASKGGSKERPPSASKGATKDRPPSASKTATAPAAKGADKVTKKPPTASTAKGAKGAKGKKGQKAEEEGPEWVPTLEESCALATAQVLLLPLLNGKTEITGGFEFASTPMAAPPTTVWMSISIH
ncbi:hypothetical protein BDK51DRAFT_53182 [Blyttiomyces helicus]|uniref:Uncharacterized protein n=1 Tax=Blyttiomyces helicus TaxID=388810 RepID=A0A4P9W9U5_9FUNG|nr:hypothetical protein BDK51DRAFT_53182 [Blyttiomyces helicus]|eukprot:RKO87908.1 hypothetical protein BDK51DRAFT_53182 [Blyttiomyces helicus]